MERMLFKVSEENENTLEGLLTLRRDEGEDMRIKRIIMETPVFP
jgi:hypothetical protein